MVRKSSTYDALDIIQLRKKELAVFTIFTLVVLILLIAFALTPMLVNISKIRTEIRMRENLNRELNTKVDALASLHEDFIGFQENLVDLPLIFPNNWNFSLFITNMDELCKNNNFKLENISLDDFQSVDGMQLLEMEHLEPWSANISVQGRLENLKHLLNALEDLPMYITVDQVSYGIDEDADEDDLMSFRINIRLYYLNDPTFYNLFD